MDPEYITPDPDMPNDIEKFLEANQDEINWDALSNPNAMPLLERNQDDKIKWDALSSFNRSNFIKENGEVDWAAYKEFEQKEFDDFHRINDWNVLRQSVEENKEESVSETETLRNSTTIRLELMKIADVFKNFHQNEMTKQALMKIADDLKNADELDEQTLMKIADDFKLVEQDFMRSVDEFKLAEQNLRIANGNKLEKDDDELTDPSGESILDGRVIELNSIQPKKMRISFKFDLADNDCDLNLNFEQPPKQMAIYKEDSIVEKKVTDDDELCVLNFGIGDVPDIDYVNYNYTIQSKKNVDMGIMFAMGITRDINKMKDINRVCRYDNYDVFGLQLFGFSLIDVSYMSTASGWQFVKNSIKCVLPYVCSAMAIGYCVKERKSMLSLFRKLV